MGCLFPQHGGITGIMRAECKSIPNILICNISPKPLPFQTIQTLKNFVRKGCPLNCALFHNALLYNSTQ